MAEITTSQRNEVRPMMPVGWRLWLWWVLASTVGWVVGGPMTGIVGGPVDMGWAVLGAVYGAITGPVLVRLLRQPVPAAPAEE